MADPRRRSARSKYGGGFRPGKEAGPQRFSPSPARGKGAARTGTGWGRGGDAQASTSTHEDAGERLDIGAQPLAPHPSPSPQGEGVIAHSCGLLAGLGEVTDACGMKVRDVIRLIERDGWFLVATRGSHRQYKHPSKPGRVTIVGKPSDDMAPGTLNSVLKQALLKELK